MSNRDEIFHPNKSKLMFWTSRSKFRVSSNDESECSRSVAIFPLVFMVIGVMLLVFLQPSFEALGALPEVSAIPPITGLVIEGHVWVENRDAPGIKKGLHDVNIYAIYAARNNAVVEMELRPIAVTDNTGYYRAHLGDVPPNSWVMVWAEKENFSFDPRRYVWQHSRGEFVKTLDFVAVPIHLLSELKIKGHVWQNSLGGGPSRIGLPGVQIFASFPLSRYDVRPRLWIRVGFTDEQGFYEGSLGFVPPRTTVKVWAVKKGYTFDPEAHTWEHHPLFDPSPKILNFIAKPENITPTPTITPTSTPTPTPTPIQRRGLKIFGQVRLADLEISLAPVPGLADVKIYLQLGSSRGIVVAVSNSSGYFESDFIKIPGEEDVKVWVQKAGYSFVPGFHEWHHPQGYEERRLEFKAIRNPTPTPLPIITIEGYVKLETLEGQGVRGVRIYQSSGSNPLNAAEPKGILLAVTNENGYYRGTISDFQAGEAIWIWPVKGWYKFRPTHYRIARFFVSVRKSYDFIAFPIRSVPGSENLPREETPRQLNEAYMAFPPNIN